MKILKFGGTSVGSNKGLKKVIEIVKERSRKERLAIVVSAMSGMTNLLSHMAKSASKGQSFEKELEQFEITHFNIAKELISVTNQNPVFTKLKLYINDLDDLLQSVSILRELSAQTNDLILSYGERCNVILVANVLKETVQNVKILESKDYILTDDAFGNASVRLDVTYKNIQHVYSKNPDVLFVITGFVAANEAGKITTLGRGGSDYTAALFGAALDASCVEIWTDVNGMLTADPRLVKKAFSLDSLSYTEAMELSYFGAKVIYPPTMIPVFKKKIPLLIKNTFEPEFKGTKILFETEKSSLPIKGISSIQNVALLNIKGSGLVGKHGFSGRLFSLMAQENINVILITQSSSEHTITIAVAEEDIVKAQNLIVENFHLEVEAKWLEPLEVEKDLAIIAIVGENMKKTPGVSGKLFFALGRNGINVRAISQGSSEYNISVVIGQKDLSKALNAIHDAFFSNLNKTINIFNIGIGNIGATLLEQFEKQKDYLKKNNDIELKLIGLSNSRKMVFKEEGINLSHWKEDLENAKEDAHIEVFIDKMRAMNLPNCVFIDNTASSQLPNYYKKIFQSNISIVTCNKIANSSSYENYLDLKDTARKYGVDFMYETNVGAGLPVISVLKNLMLSGDRILKMEAILSGTISYIFNHFVGDVEFDEVVKNAQDLGYTEPDPREDLSGSDFMRKMLILGRDAGFAVETKDVNLDSILPKECLDASSVSEFYDSLKSNASYFNDLKAKAKNENKVIRYIGTLEHGKLSISLEFVGEEHPFYSLSGSDNIISFTTDRYQDRPLVIKGPGAGAEVTAAGVFGDLVNLSSII